MMKTIPFLLKVMDVTVGFKIGGTYILFVSNSRKVDSDVILYESNLASIKYFVVGSRDVNVYDSCPLGTRIHSVKSIPLRAALEVNYLINYIQLTQKDLDKILIVYIQLRLLR